MDRAERAAQIGLRIPLRCTHGRFVIRELREESFVQLLKGRPAIAARPFLLHKWRGN
jgi:hypothetical protein